MDVDQALHNSDNGLAGPWEAETLAAEVRRLRAEQHEVACPSCGATIRARLADQDEQAELTRLRARIDELEGRAREVLAEEPVHATDHAARGTARRILGSWT